MHAAMEARRRYRGIEFSGGTFESPGWEMVEKARKIDLTEISQVANNFSAFLGGDAMRKLHCLPCESGPPGLTPGGSISG